MIIRSLLFLLFLPFISVPLPLSHLTHRLQVRQAATNQTAFQQNVALAQSMNVARSQQTAGGSCTIGQEMCVGDSLAVCASGKFVVVGCGGGTHCLVVPLNFIPGTTVSCLRDEVVQMAFTMATVASGTTPITSSSTSTSSPSTFKSQVGGTSIQSVFSTLSKVSSSAAISTLTPTSTTITSTKVGNIEASSTHNFFGVGLPLTSSTTTFQTISRTIANNNSNVISTFSPNSSSTIEITTGINSTVSSTSTVTNSNTGPNVGMATTTVTITGTGTQTSSSTSTSQTTFLPPSPLFSLPILSSTQPTSTPSATASPSSSNDPTFQSNLSAAKQMEVDKFIKNEGDSCQVGDMECIGLSLASCPAGALVRTSCDPGLECHIVPLRFQQGTIVACMTPEDAQSRLQNN